MLYSIALALLYNSGRPLNAANERVCSLSGNSLRCLYWSSVMPSTMPDPSDPGATTSISLIYRHAIFGFFQYEKSEVSPGAESRPDWTVALAKRGKLRLLSIRKHHHCPCPAFVEILQHHSTICLWVENRNRSILVGMLASP